MSLRVLGDASKMRDTRQPLVHELQAHIITGHIMLSVRVAALGLSECAAVAATARLRPRCSRSSETTVFPDELQHIFNQASLHYSASVQPLVHVWCLRGAFTP
jgi:hypothetical protein